MRDEEGGRREGMEDEGGCWRMLGDGTNKCWTLRAAPLMIARARRVSFWSGLTLDGSGFNKQGACIDWTQTGGCSECAPWCDCARAARRTDVTRTQVQRGAHMQRSALVQRRTQYRCTYVTTAVNNVLE